jgi:hypothetical protein
LADNTFMGDDEEEEEEKALAVSNLITLPTPLVY